MAIAEDNLLFRPPHRPLNGSAIVPLRTAGEIGIQVDPSLNMKRLKLVERQIYRNCAHKTPKPILVPAIGVGAAMLLDKIEKGIDHDGNEFCSFG